MRGILLLLYVVSCAANAEMFISYLTNVSNTRLHLDTYLNKLGVPDNRVTRIDMTNAIDFRPQAPKLYAVFMLIEYPSFSQAQSECGRVTITNVVHPETGIYLCHAEYSLSESSSSNNLSAMAVVSIVFTVFILLIWIVIVVDYYYHLII